MKEFMLHSLCTLMEEELTNKIERTDQLVITLADGSNAVIAIDVIKDGRCLYEKEK